MFNPEEIKTNVILVYDSVQVFYEATRKINITMEELDCNTYNPWIYGSSLLNFMRTVICFNFSYKSYKTQESPNF